MQLFDIHTHTTDTQGNISVFNSNYIITTGRLCSLGIHPWDITEEWHATFQKIVQAAKNRNVAAIGECGFDFVRATAAHELQYKIFSAHITLSEALERPLIIHLVKGAEELSRALKEHNPKQAWILHGFRGKPEQAMQFINNGLYLSFGTKFNATTVIQTPIERMFIESDEQPDTLAETYRQIASIKGIEPENLAKQIFENARRCNIAL